MTVIGLVVVGLVLLILDISLGGLISVWSVRPSFTLPFVVYVGLQRGPIEGTLFGAATGIGQDLFGVLPVGATSLAYSIVGFACGKLWSEGPFRILWPWAAFLALAAVVSEAILHYFLARGTGLDFLTLFLTGGLPGAVYTSIIGLTWFLSPLHRERRYEI